MPFFIEDNVMQMSCQSNYHFASDRRDSVFPCFVSFVAFCKHSPMNTQLTRRDLLKLASLGTAGTTLGMLSGCEQRETNTPASASSAAAKSINPNEEYVWLSANANLPLFTAHDHPALELAGKELGV